MSEILQSNSEQLSDSQIQEQVARFAGNAYKEGVNPVDLFDLENGIEGLASGDMQRVDVEPAILVIRDKLGDALASKVIARGELAQGAVSRAGEVSSEEILEVAIDAYRSALINSRYETVNEG